MKTGIGMLQDGFSLINVSNILTSITGRIYLGERPQNSTLQDIVLNTLALTNEQLQQGVFNVNVHCPNLSVTIGDKTDNTLPDTAKLLEVGKKIISILNDYIGFDFRLSVATPGNMIRDDKDGSWYLNIRVNYYAFQQSYSNI